MSIAITRVGGFGAPIHVGLARPPGGIRATSAVTRRNAVTLTLEIPDAIPAGRYSLTLLAAAGSVVHMQIVSVYVKDSAPHAVFTSPAPGLTIQAAARARLAWNERPGDARIVGRQLITQAGRVATPGTCAGVSFATQSIDSTAAPGSQRVSSGSCYRWLLTLTDAHGLRSVAHSGTLLVDASPPRPFHWISAPSGSTQTIRGTAFRLRWAGGSDAASGLAPEQLVARYRAGLTASGSCRLNGFTLDTPLHRTANGSIEKNLAAGACYVWTVRTVDKAGNSAGSVVSGYVITPRR